MSEIKCKICGSLEDPDHFIQEISDKLKHDQFCFSCFHWSEQLRLDKEERGDHGWAVIDGVHYVLLPHTDINWPRGMGGAKMRIKFLDGYETMCDNLWCQGNIPEIWKSEFPDNATFIEN